VTAAREPEGVDVRGEGVRVSTLNSRVRIVTEAMPDVRSVTIGFWVGIGSRDERGSAVGASHFLEHLLFKGTRRRSAQEIAEAIDAVGGDLNAFTSKEYTCFYAHTLDRDLPLAIDVLGDMFTSATIRSGDVDAERAVVLEEIRMHLDTPEDLVHSVFNEGFFGDHPLGREVLGSEQSITAMSRERVHRYYRRHYVPDTLVVAVAGNVEHDDVVERVAEVLDGWETGAGVGAAGLLRRAEPRRTPPCTVVRPRPTEQSHIVLGGPGLPRGDDRRFVAGVLNQAVGGGMASRLFQEVRERRGLAYTVYSYLGMHVDAGTFAVYAGTAPERTTEVLDVVVAELEKAADGGLEEAELERAKGYMAGSTVLALEDTSSRMTRLGKSVVSGTPLLGLDETLAAIEAVTVEQIRALAGAILAGPFTLALVGPFDGASPVEFDRYLRRSAA
jgi:predicted Zn-dependent peptidase